MQGLADRNRAVIKDIQLDPSRKLRLESGEKLANAINDLDGIGTGLPEDCQNDAATLIVPAEILVVFYAIDDAGDLLEADGKAIPIRDNDLAKILRTLQFAGGFDRSRFRSGVELSGSLIGICFANRVLNVIESDPAGGEFPGIDLDADRELLRAEIST